MRYPHEENTTMRLEPITSQEWLLLHPRPHRNFHSLNHPPSRKFHRARIHITLPPTTNYLPLRAHPLTSYPQPAITLNHTIVTPPVHGKHSQRQGLYCFLKHFPANTTEIDSQVVYSLPKGYEPKLKIHGPKLKNGHLTLTQFWCPLHPTFHFLCPVILSFSVQ